MTVPDAKIAEAHAHFRLGQALLRGGRAEDARAQFTEATHLHPDSWVMWWQTAEKSANGLAVGEDFWRRVDALGERPYYAPADLAPASTPRGESPTRPNPYDALPAVPSFTVTSDDVRDGEPMRIDQRGDAGGEGLSPQLSWSGFPAETKTFAVTVFDADAPTPSGFSHWAMFDIPANVTSLPSNAGSADGTRLPAGALQLKNDARLAQYVGAAPPPGTGTHRYFIVVHALDVETLPFPWTRPRASLVRRLGSDRRARYADRDGGDALGDMRRPSPIERIAKVEARQDGGIRTRPASRSGPRLCRRGVALGGRDEHPARREGGAARQ